MIGYKRFIGFPRNVAKIGAKIWQKYGKKLLTMIF